MNQPRINQPGFVAVQHNKVVAIVPDGRLDESIAALAEIGVDLGQVDVLQGEAGAAILDFDGTEHGRWAHLVRAVQKLGTASNERENYAGALRDGGAARSSPRSAPTPPTSSAWSTSPRSASTRASRSAPC